jgi:hypothetical protein
MILFFSNSAPATSSGSDSKPTHDIAIKNVSAPNSCVRGDTVTVKVSVANKGSHRETFRVMLTDTNSGKEIASNEVTLAKVLKAESENVADLVFDAEADEVDYFGARICWDPEETGTCNIGSFLNAGYINNDECEDFVYSAPVYDNCRGRVYVYYGSNYFDSTADFILTGEQTNMKFGHSLCLGDMNNDSYDDIIAGAGWWNSKQGRVHIYYTGSNFDDNVDVYLDNPESTASRFGRQVRAGDINNDNYDDLFVTAISYNSDRGRIYLYYGGASFDTVPDKVFEVENEAGDLFGKEMAIGDVDGDSFGDLIVGSRDFDDGRGRAYLFWGAAGTRMDTTVDVIFTGEAKRNQLGGGVNISDIDGDGAGELLIGARYWNNGQGRVSIYWGGTKNIDPTKADVYLYGKTDPHMSHLGERGLVCGNFNGDNYLDVLTGGSGSGISQGRAFIFYGDAKTTMDNIPDHVFYGESVNGGYAGESIKVDLNNDGYDEAVIPDVLYSRAPKPERGRIYLYYNRSPSLKEISFAWDTTNASTGKHTLKVEITPIDGEKDTADNIYTTIVNIKAP